MYDYDANDDEELSFREGDRMEVTDKESDDWWMAKHTSGSTGLIPSNYVKETSAASSIVKKRGVPSEQKKKKVAMFTTTTTTTGSSSTKKTSSSRNNNTTKKKKKKKNDNSNPKANFLASIQNVKSAKGLARSKKSHKKKSNETKNRDRRRIAIESMMTADAVGCDDMVLLPKLSNKAIAQNLEVRHAKDLIYTYIGNVLISVRSNGSRVCLMIFRSKNIAARIELTFRLISLQLRRMPIE
jgi:hypothetical protein